MNKFIAKNKRELVVALATLAMAAIFTIMNPAFVTWNNILTVLQQMVLNGILAVGIMFTIITGGIDLSIGCTYAITGICVAWCTVHGVNPFLAILIGIIIGLILGAFNGFLVTGMKLQPFIATLGTMSLYRGIAYVVTGGIPVTNVPDSYRNIFNGKMVFGLRYYILVMVIVFVIGYIILAKTRTGAYLYAVGGNEAAAIGGTRMAGGRGTAFGTFIGALMLAVLKVGMVVINVDSFWQYVVTGLIIIIASYFEFMQADIAAFMARKSNK